MAEQWMIDPYTPDDAVIVGVVVIDEKGVEVICRAGRERAQQIVADHDAARQQATERQAHADLRTAVTNALPGLHALLDENAALAAYDPGTRFAAIIADLRAALARPDGGEGGERRRSIDCTRCGDPISDGYMIGDGDGSGQRFAHPECYRQYPGAYKLREPAR